MTLNFQRNDLTSSDAKILVVDDEPNIRFFLERVLSKEGYEVITAASGEESLAVLQAEVPDLVLLDLKLNDMSGLDVLETLRQRRPDTAVIILTGYASLETAVEALRHGANDYLYKPTRAANLRESVRQALRKRQRKLRQEALIDRLEATLASGLEQIRATEKGDIDEGPPPVLGEDVYETSGEGAYPSACEFLRCVRCGPWVVDFTRHRIAVEGERLDLTPTEFAILAHMIGEAPRVIPHQEFVSQVQGYDGEAWGANETVRYHIHNIRNKIEKVGGQPTLIRTVRGVGYAVDAALT